jgi:hypothetical protein
VKDSKKYLDISLGQMWKVASLPGLMASALHPNCTDMPARAALQSKFDKALRTAVKAGQIKVCNPQSLETIQSPSEDELLGAKVMPEQFLLRQFFERHGLEQRMTEDGNGPKYWTLENAAKAIQIQEEWHDGSRATLLKQLIIAALDGTLKVRHPHTNMAYVPTAESGYNSLVMPADVNVWLKDVDYKWYVVVPDLNSDIEHLKANKPDEAPALAILAPTVDTVSAVVGKTKENPNPELNLPWWQTVHDIKEMWQNIGATLHSKGDRTSNVAIAKEIKNRINGIERSKGRSRDSPSWDTIRGLFTGKRWKPK